MSLPFEGILDIVYPFINVWSVNKKLICLKTNSKKVKSKSFFIAKINKLPCKKVPY